jgi:glycosyltransferase involved in cell wall biosynthesis
MRNFQIPGGAFSETCFYDQERTIVKISIFTPNLSGNCAGRAWVLGKLLKEEFEVEIIGPTESGRVWSPLEEERDIRFIPVQAFSKLSEFKKQAQALRLAATGDAIYVSKPLHSIMYPAILEKQENNKPFFLDIDDWQMGFQYKKLTSPLGLCRVLSREMLYACGFDSFWNALAGDKHIRHADAISVSNNYLQAKYGGTLIPHARDGSFLDPDNYAKDVEKAKLGISSDTRIVAFIGSPRPHKGLQDLIEAVGRVREQNILLMVVGLSSDEYSTFIRTHGEKLLGTRFIGFGMQLYAELPRFLSVADIIVIPQRNTSATVGQTPAKVFDAMAMSKPIIATDVGDLPSILNGCGSIVPPGNISALARQIEEILANYDAANKGGQLARKKFLEVYDVQALGKKISGMIHNGLNRAP